MAGMLDLIHKANDIKKIEPQDYPRLAKEIRRFLVDHISKTGGHLASNLGMVELTMALHLTMNFPEDKLIFDVGHQAYTHKILTGRKDLFPTLRKYHGLSGFPKREESDCDCFDTGHSSTSISAALGYAKARDIRGEHYKVCAVIGDGALTGGMAYEALNNAATLKSNLVIVLNDNKMSIAGNVGGMTNYLGKIRVSSRYMDLKDDVEEALRHLPAVGEGLIKKIRKSKDSIKRLFIPGIFFEDMGITYIGPVDGHDMKQLLTALRTAQHAEKAVLVHVVTKKGKGYVPAERDPELFHGIGAFHKRTGIPEETEQALTYTQAFSDVLMEEAKKEPYLAAITAAMPQGTGLSEFAAAYPERFFDVGIAEEHAVTFAAGLAAGGIHPIFAVYSTFLQRSYDQILHDVALQKLPVTFMIDRAGIVGSDGATHQGIFDYSYLSTVPGLTIMAPKNVQEMKEMFRFAIHRDYPVAIRYPRGAAYEGLSEFKEEIVKGHAEVLYRERRIVLLAIGSMVETASSVREALKKKGYEVSLVNMRFLKPLDTALLKELSADHEIYVTMEENITTGGLGRAVGSFLHKEGIGAELWAFALPDEFIEHGSPQELLRQYGLDAESILKRLCCNLEVKQKMR